MNKILKALGMAIVAGAMYPGFPASASDGVEVNQLGVTNALVRVTGDNKYILFPVQESSDDAKINVVVDGKIAETIFVRLAKSKTDYTVPFDLTPYQGHNVIFDIVMPQDRGSIREIKDDSCWRGITLADTFDISNREKYRPAFHHTPLYGWMNDPNGMFYKDGKWHLYYQYNPYGSKWQNMTWAHSVSSDLVNWEHLPIAIRPNGLGSVFSGSCAIDTENSAGYGKDAVIAMYTSAGISQMQSLAASNDEGTTFEIFNGNPVLTLESEARDPNMFWNPDTKEWTLVLAHALDKEMLFFTSPDMKKWTLTGNFGKGLGAQDGVWECPDLFQLPVDGTEKSKWVLICNINPGGPFGGSGIQYFIGDFDGKTFTSDTDASGNVPTKWLDHGKDNYALVSWSDAPDNRRTTIGWMSNWQYAADVPTKQFRSANTLPREIGLFTAPDGEIYAYSAPSPELEMLRGPLVKQAGKVNIGNKPSTYALPSTNDGICEILMDIDAQKASNINLILSNKAGEEVILVYNVKNRSFSFDRTRSGITDFSESFPAVTVAPTHEVDGKVALRIFVDRSSIELFGNNGQFVMTNLVFPTTPYTTLTLSSDGGNAKVENLKIYSINE
ncbi:MAG: GH32 C-terminal domain-containing protein [Duncaniella sp.]|nr:GH32 C-terminal domain-containing protein [Muribaculum sp.]MCM1255472.1 GH32 C-terminal domain-containing protein [Duncaniella sp.]